MLPPLYLPKACMPASFMILIGQPKADSKSKPIHPAARLCGSEIGRFCTTTPGYPIETAEYFQSPANRFTPETICCGVMVGPEGNFRGVSCPVTRIFT